jgi:hypothetical protein
MTPSDSSSLEDNILGTLARELKHEYTRVRRNAVERAGEMLKVGQYPSQVMNLLQTVALSDSNLGVRDIAQQVLDKYKETFPIKTSPDRGPATIEVYCSLGHASSFDKRDLCKNLGRYWRRSVLREDLPFQEVVLTCQTCGEDIIVDLDCEGYD